MPVEESFAFASQNIKISILRGDEICPCQFLHISTEKAMAKIGLIHDLSLSGSPAGYEQDVSDDL
jgi:hypothetical protein